MSCSTDMCDIKQQECTDRLFVSADRSHGCFGAKSQTKSEHVQPSAFRFEGRNSWGAFHPVPCHVFVGHHMLCLRGRLCPSQHADTKMGFHKWISTCYILDLQREPLRDNYLLLENREWWLLGLEPHSWGACCTLSHLTNLIPPGAGSPRAPSFILF